jgi:hypothetical protein
MTGGEAASLPALDDAVMSARRRLARVAEKGYKRFKPFIPFPEEQTDEHPPQDPDQA